VARGSFDLRRRWAGEKDDCTGDRGQQLAPRDRSELREARRANARLGVSAIKSKKETAMAVGMLIELNINEKKYDRVNEVLGFYDNPPKGLIMHAAGPTDSGRWRVFDIWESRELFEQFYSQRLKSALQQADATEPPLMQDFFPIHNTYVPQPTVLTSLTRAGTAGAPR
jgi:hypothetical protein